MFHSTFRSADDVARYMGSLKNRYNSGKERVLRHNLVIAKAFLLFNEPDLADRALQEFIQYTSHSSFEVLSVEAEVLFYKARYRDSLDRYRAACALKPDNTVCPTFAATCCAHIAASKGMINSIDEASALIIEGFKYLAHIRTVSDNAGHRKADIASQQLFNVMCARPNAFQHLLHDIIVIREIDTLLLPTHEPEDTSSFALTVLSLLAETRELHRFLDRVPWSVMGNIDPDSKLNLLIHQQLLQAVNMAKTSQRVKRGLERYIWHTLSANINTYPTNLPFLNQLIKHYSPTLRYELGQLLQCFNEVFDAIITAFHANNIKPNEIMIQTAMTHLQPCVALIDNYNLIEDDLGRALLNRASTLLTMLALCYPQYRVATSYDNDDVVSDDYSSILSSRRRLSEVSTTYTDMARKRLPFYFPMFKETIRMMCRDRNEMPHTLQMQLQQHGSSLSKLILEQQHSHISVVRNVANVLDIAQGWLQDGQFRQWLKSLFPNIRDTFEQTSTATTCIQRMTRRPVLSTADIETFFVIMLTHRYIVASTIDLPDCDLGLGDDKFVGKAIATQLTGQYTPSKLQQNFWQTILAEHGAHNIHTGMVACIFHSPQTLLRQEEVDQCIRQIRGDIDLAPNCMATDFARCIYHVIYQTYKDLSEYRGTDRLAGCRWYKEKGHNTQRFLQSPCSVSTENVNSVGILLPTASVIDLESTYTIIFEQLRSMYHGAPTSTPTLRVLPIDELDYDLPDSQYMASETGIDVDDDSNTTHDIAVNLESNTSHGKPHSKRQLRIIERIKQAQQKPSRKAHIEILSSLSPILPLLPLVVPPPPPPPPPLAPAFSPAFREFTPKPLESFDMSSINGSANISLLENPSLIFQPFGSSFGHSKKSTEPPILFAVPDAPQFSFSSSDVATPFSALLSEKVQIQPSQDSSPATSSDAIEAKETTEDITANDITEVTQSTNLSEQLHDHSPTIYESEITSTSDRNDSPVFSNFTNTYDTYDDSKGSVEENVYKGANFFENVDTVEKEDVTEEEDDTEGNLIEKEVTDEEDVAEEDFIEEQNIFEEEDVAKEDLMKEVSVTEEEDDAEEDLIEEESIKEDFIEEGNLDRKESIAQEENANSTEDVPEEQHLSEEENLITEEDTPEKDLDSGEYASEENLAEEENIQEKDLVEEEKSFEEEDFIKNENAIETDLERDEAPQSLDTMELENNLPIETSTSMSLDHTVTSIPRVDLSPSSPVTPTINVSCSPLQLESTLQTYTPPVRISGEAGNDEQSMHNRDEEVEIKNGDENMSVKSLEQVPDHDYEVISDDELLGGEPCQNEALSEQELGDSCSWSESGESTSLETQPTDNLYENPDKISDESTIMSQSSSLQEEPTPIIEFLDDKYNNGRENDDTPYGGIDVKVELASDEDKEQCKDEDASSFLATGQHHIDVMNGQLSENSITEDEKLTLASENEHSASEFSSTSHASTSKAKKKKKNKRKQRRQHDIASLETNSVLPAKEHDAAAVSKIISTLLEDAIWSKDKHSVPFEDSFDRQEMKENNSIDTINETVQEVAESNELRFPISGDETQALSLDDENISDANQPINESKMKMNTTTKEPISSSLATESSLKRSSPLAGKSKIPRLISRSSSEISDNKEGLRMISSSLKADKTFAQMAALPPNTSESIADIDSKPFHVSPSIRPRSALGLSMALSISPTAYKSKNSSPIPRYRPSETMGLNMAGKEDGGGHVSPNSHKLIVVQAASPPATRVRNASGSSTASTTSVYRASQDDEVDRHIMHKTSAKQPKLLSSSIEMVSPDMDKRSDLIEDWDKDLEEIYGKDVLDMFADEKIQPEHELFEETQLFEQTLDLIEGEDLEETIKQSERASSSEDDLPFKDIQLPEIDALQEFDFVEEESLLPSNIPILEKISQDIDIKTVDKEQDQIEFSDNTPILINELNQGSFTPSPKKKKKKGKKTLDKDEASSPTEDIFAPNTDTEASPPPTPNTAQKATQSQTNTPAKSRNRRQGNKKKKHKK